MILPHEIKPLGKSKAFLSINNLTRCRSWTRINRLNSKSLWFEKERMRRFFEQNTVKVDIDIEISFQPVSFTLSSGMGISGAPPLPLTENP